MEFEALVKKLTPTLKRIAYKLNGHYTCFNHDDLYQEALMHLWGQFMGRQIYDKTDSYILQGCYFHLKNYIRKTKTKLNISSLDEMLEDKDGLSRDRFSFLEDKDSGAFKERLNERLLVEAMQNNGLTPREKLILAFLKDGLTTRQIGSRLKVSHVGVVKMIAKIRQRSQGYAREL